jgi:hypothetical protein
MKSLCLLAATCQAAIQLTKNSNTEQLLDQNKVNLILYYDTYSRDKDQWIDYFNKVEFAMPKKYFSFFTVDARMYPQFEDERMSFAINHSTKSAANNYVLALTEGRIRQLDWSAQQGFQVLEAKLIDYFYLPI